MDASVRVGWINGLFEDRKGLQEVCWKAESLLRGRKGGIGVVLVRLDMLRGGEVVLEGCGWRAIREVTWLGKDFGSEVKSFET